MSRSGTPLAQLSLASYDGPFHACLGNWRSVHFGRRLWQKDPTLWAQGPAPEIVDRLGWLRLADTMKSSTREFRALAEEAISEGIRTIVLLGMGGSSLAPELFAQTFGAAPDHPRLLVLDSTHPAAVARVRASIDPAHTWFLVSSKSGTTLEPLSFFRFFWKEFAKREPVRPQHFIAITDPGTPLELLAHDRGFRAVIQATPDVGGRYSALTAFGLVPAAFLGIDLDRLLDRALSMAIACGPDVVAEQNPGLSLGAALGTLGRSGIDKITFLNSPSLAAFPSWAEQLIAESTGKNGRGLIPIVGELPRPPQFYGADRFFISLHLAADPPGVDVDKLFGVGRPFAHFELGDRYDVAAEFFRWEMAIAAAGAVLGIQPFNQPDVELAKELARKAMQSTQGDVTEEPPLSEPVDPGASAVIGEWLSEARSKMYLALQVFVAPSEEVDRVLNDVRSLLGDRVNLPVTVGYGPRFLHSTGQLHKGGPPTGHFLQLVDRTSRDLPVPETDFTFGQIIRAQAQGDAQALAAQGRYVLRVDLGSDSLAGLRALAASIRHLEN